MSKQLLALRIVRCIILACLVLITIIYNRYHADSIWYTPLIIGGTCAFFWWTWSFQLTPSVLSIENTASRYFMWLCEICFFLGSVVEMISFFTFAFSLPIDRVHESGKIEIGNPLCISLFDVGFSFCVLGVAAIGASVTAEYEAFKFK